MTATEIWELVKFVCDDDRVKYPRGMVWVRGSNEWYIAHVGYLTSPDYVCWIFEGWLRQYLNDRHHELTCDCDSVCIDIGGEIRGFNGESYLHALIAAVKATLTHDDGIK